MKEKVSRLLTNFFVNRMISDPKNIENPSVRKAYGTLSSVVCMVCNILLFSIKYLAGSLSGSIAILSDAFNNLSDCANCLITFFGYRMAAKPADKGHPFGHGRMEYLTSLLIAVLIAIMGVELLRDSFDKLRHPAPVTFRWMVLGILLLSILIKLWMALFNQKLGKQCRSSAILATAKDSYSDVLATTSTLIVLVVSRFTDFPLDGWMGILVSLFILKTAYDIIKDTVDDLLGKPADAALVKQICQLIRSHSEILGIHDLVIHNYGMGKRIGSCHVEVSSHSDFVAIHDLVDNIEHINACRSMLLHILHQLDPHLHMHDFRMVAGETHTNLIFDLVVPFDCVYKNDQLKEMIESALAAQPIQYYTIITFDREYTAIDSETDSGENF